MHSVRPSGALWRAAALAASELGLALTATEQPQLVRMCCHAAVRALSQNNGSADNDDDEPFELIVSTHDGHRAHAGALSLWRLG